jgi:hypothetical protein
MKRRSLHPRMAGLFSDFSSTIVCVPEINPVSAITFQE